MAQYGELVCNLSSVHFKVFINESNTWLTKSKFSLNVFDILGITKTAVLLVVHRAAAAGVIPAFTTRISVAENTQKTFFN